MLYESGGGAPGLTFRASFFAFSSQEHACCCFLTYLLMVFKVVIFGIDQLVSNRAQFVSHD